LKPAGPGRDYRALVKQTYDQIAADYNQGRLDEPADADYLTPLIERLTPGARVLDLGCGAGVPITRALAERHEVTGVDFSSKQLALARLQVPAARFIQTDMTSCDFPQAHFDAVVSFFAIFHLPREEQDSLFERVHGWLKPGGYFLATLALENEAAYTEDDYFGREMYWSNFGIEEYRRLLIETGFEPVGEWLQADSDEAHPLLLVRRA
jgi:cyclopropane fatty-acyl-phospholipid synthase-like methyltransferase